MKKMKKLLSMLLTVIMVLAMAAPSFADEVPSTGTITINNAIKDQTYSAYKLFELESFSGSNYSYKVVDAWKPFLAGYTNFTIDSNGYLTSNTEMTAAEAESFAKAALDFAKKEGTYKDREGTVINPVYTATSVEKTEMVNGKETTVYTATFSSVALGYYLIDSSAGTVCALDTTKPNIDINEKNVEPNATKTTPVTTVTIGQIVPYTITINAQPGAENYIAYDKMSTGLTFNDASLSVKMGGTLTDAIDVDNESNKAYTLIDTGLTDDRTFEVRFTPAFCNSITTATNIYIQYNATVNENAITVSAITNEAGLTYGNNNGASTVPSIVTVNTYLFNLKKVDNTQQKNVLQNATFKLYRRDGEEGNYTYTRINVLPVTNGTANQYRAAGELTTEQDNDENGLITAGEVSIDGLGNGTYVLEEVAAPAGYNKLVGYTNPIVIENADNTAGLEVINSTGALLPSTGGIGTTIFYAAGIVLMAGAVFFVVRRKKA